MSDKHIIIFNPKLVLLAWGRGRELGVFPGKLAHERGGRGAKPAGEVPRPRACRSRELERAVAANEWRSRIVASREQRWTTLGHDVFYLCFSSSARIDFSLWREKKNKKISKKMRPSGQVRVDKYCPRQAQRKRQIARRKKQYYGDWWRR